MFTLTQIIKQILLLLLINITYGERQRITLVKFPEITNCGHPYEYHDIITEDGYMLTLFRVNQEDTDKNTTTNRPAVIFVPGLICSVSVFVNFGPEKSLPCLLAKNGYDVWLINFRGTTWSRKHINLNPDVDRKQFWDFTLHEVSYYDIPAAIDYILALSHQESLYYVGHSQGGTIFLTMAASRAEYEKKVRLMVALAPTVFVGNSITPLSEIVTLTKTFLNKATKAYDIYEIASHSPGLVQMIQMLCSEYSPIQPYCVIVYLSLLGHTPHQVNTTLFPLIISNFPAGTSIDLMMHSMQFSEKKLDRYDYGDHENKKRYGQATPPEYDITKISTPFAVYYSNKDYLINPKNIDFLVSQLPNVVLKMMLKGFNHMDLLYGMEAPMLFNHVLGVMNNYRLLK